MKIAIAGSDTRGAELAVKKHGLPKLYSILGQRKNIEEYDDDHLLIIDSGAHSWNKEAMHNVGMKRKNKIQPAEEFIEVYNSFVRKNVEKKCVFVEFDVYGHLPKKQIDKMAKKIKKINLAGKFMRVYHPIIDSDLGLAPLTTLRQWIDEGETYIGIGNDSKQHLDDIFALTRDEIRIHGFAMTKLKTMERYPFFSVDSTSPLSTVIFGRYTKPVMNFRERSDIVITKSIEAYHDDWERLENAIIETKKTQDYITNLWKKKGVIWTDLKF